VVGRPGSGLQLDGAFDAGVRTGPGDALVVDIQFRRGPGRLRDMVELILELVTGREQSGLDQILVRPAAIGESECPVHEDPEAQARLRGAVQGMHRSVLGLGAELVRARHEDLVLAKCFSRQHFLNARNHFKGLHDHHP